MCRNDIIRFYTRVLLHRDWHTLVHRSKSAVLARMDWSWKWRMLKKMGFGAPFHGIRQLALPNLVTLDRKVWAWMWWVSQKFALCGKVPGGLTPWVYVESIHRIHHLGSWPYFHSSCSYISLLKTYLMALGYKTVIKRQLQRRCVSERSVHFNHVA